jgi:predicted lipoprotein with Yx(FWY)xxD motif
MPLTAIRGRATSAAVLAAVALFVAACGSSASNSSSSGSAAAGSSSPATAKAMLRTASGSLGTYLTDGSGRALYLWVADSHGASVCSGACAQAWPPLLTKGAPAAAGAVKASYLGTVNRTGGATQVTYKGHPLYYYIGDTAAHQTTGQGSDGFGAKWWLLTPAGAAITKLGASGAPSAY